jgi:hypothetical protein
LPALFKATDSSSESAQRSFYLYRGTELAALILAAVAAELGSTVLWGIGPALALLLFFAALVLRVSGAGTRAEHRWYDARAAAESIKSMSWQYAVGGESFRVGDDTADSRFKDGLKKSLAVLSNLDVAVKSGESRYGVSTEMKALRASSLEDRVSAYRTGRVDDQVEWYRDNSTKNRRRSRQWTVALVAVECVAVLLGLGRVMEWFDVDWLGLVAAVAAALAAWQQVKNYSELSEAYAVTSHEVGLLADDLDPGSSEEEWAQQVHDAEAAFSREHTLWLARRQGPAVT